MFKEQETLAELRRLINEQSRTLQGRLSDVDLIRCTLRGERIKQLFEAVRSSSSQPVLAPTKTVNSSLVNEPHPFSYVFLVTQDTDLRQPSEEQSPGERDRPVFPRQGELPDAVLLVPTNAESERFCPNQAADSEILWQKAKPSPSAVEGSN